MSDTVNTTEEKGDDRKMYVAMNYPSGGRTCEEVKAELEKLGAEVVEIIRTPMTEDEIAALESELRAKGLFRT